MPVPVEQLDQIAATVAEVYRAAEVSLARLIARHLSGDLSSDMTAPAWAERKLAAVRDLRRAAEAVVAGLSVASDGAFREAAAEAFRAGATSALAELPKAWFPQSGIGQAAEQAAAELPGFGAIEALAAAVHEDIGDKSRNILRDVVDTYRDVIAAATARTITGSQTRREAAQAAWRRFTDRGITSFTDRSGRRWQLASYVEMATRTVTQRAAVQGQTDRLDALGVRLVMVSNAPQECELCRPFEGRVLSLGDGPTGRVEVEHATRDGETVSVRVKDTLDGARLKGFQHPNCRHSVSAYLPGISRLPEQPTADPDGDKAREQQRALEREIRRHKLAQAAALDEQARKDAGRKVRAAQARLREHLDEHPDLKRLPYREQIGAGNIPPGGRNDAAGAIGTPVQRTIDGETVPTGRRQSADEQAPIGQAVADDPDQLALDDIVEPIDLAALDDEQLDALFADLSESGDDDLLDAVLAEMDRRATAADERAPASETWVDELFAGPATVTPDEPVDDEPIENADEWARFDELLAAGVEEREAYAEAFGKDADRLRREETIVRLRDEGHTGKGFDELARSAFRERLDQDYFAAEDATRGVLLTRAGENAGVNARDLWRNNEAFARKWASDELKEWWDEHGRITFDVFKAELLSGQSEQRFRTGGETWLQ